MTAPPSPSVVHGAPAQPQDLPATDRLLRHAAVQPLLADHGHTLVADEARVLLAACRAEAVAGTLDRAQAASDALAQALAARIAARLAPRMRPVLNLTGTVIHTNLGRAVLADVALDHVAATLRGPNNLEYDLTTGGRGDRDSLVEDLLCTLTGAEAATVVNNNAAAVVLTLAALAGGREAIVSRGELVEIGGAFRIPDVMRRAQVRLVEIGTTNRTHEKDYAEAIGAKTALLMKVHTSNYVVTGFTKSVDERAVADIAHAAGLPFVVDLGSGTLTDFAALGLPAEPTPQQALAAGADIVTFSGDKLLGGPQAGLIVGRKDLIAKIKKNPLKRALRVGKTTLAALEATLRLYRDPDRLCQRLPTLRLLTRPTSEIAALGERLLPAVQAAVGAGYVVTLEDCASQIGSGALPVERLASTSLVLRSTAKKPGKALAALEASFRGLPQPVIGSIRDDAFRLDLRCLEDKDEARFVAQLSALQL